ncbi:hypothetical protein MHYP_G00243520 [Metynnis hypsauchen]
MCSRGWARLGMPIMHCGKSCPEFKLAVSASYTLELYQYQSEFSRLLYEMNSFRGITTKSTAEIRKAEIIREHQNRAFQLLKKGKEEFGGLGWGVYAKPHSMSAKPHPRML